MVVGVFLKQIDYYSFIGKKNAINTFLDWISNQKI
jgi:hypothetical protein